MRSDHFEAEVPPRAMRIAFRTDASPGVGTGHLRRCLTLAREAERLGHDVAFVVPSFGNLISDLVAGAGYEVLVTTARPGPVRDLTKNPDWSSPSLISAESDDAAAFIRAIHGSPPDLVVVDDYFITQRWIDHIRPRLGSQFVVIEDLNRIWGDTEFIINGNLNATIHLTEASSAHALAGSRYAFVSDEYRKFRKAGLTAASSRKNITVFVGGGDTKNLTFDYLKTALACVPKRFAIDVVVGSANGELASILNLASTDHRVSVHVDLPSLAEIYARSALALGSGGTTSWERACMGVPAIVTAVAENQEPICVALAEAGLARFLGNVGSVTHEQISSIVGPLLKTPQELERMSVAGQLLVDGLGARRAIAIASGVRGPVSLRPASFHDADVLFAWTNDPTVRQNSTKREGVDWNNHLVWLDQRLKSADTQLFILELAGLPVGQIRFDRDTDRQILSYSIDQDFRSRGLGKKIIELGIEALDARGANKLLAVVRHENHVSIRVFETLGFSVERSTTEFVYFMTPLV